MRQAKITKTCTVFKDAVVEIRDSHGRPSVRVRFIAGGEYRLPEWWYTPLLEQGALTAPGGAAPPAWAQPASGTDQPTDSGEE